MAKFLAMRVYQDKLAFDDVPDKYKAEVRGILIEDYGWVEEDF